MIKTIIDKTNDISIAALRSGPAVFWNWYLWKKIHEIHISHSKRGVTGSEIGIVPKRMIEDVHKKLFVFSY